MGGSLKETILGSAWLFGKGQKLRNPFQAGGVYLKKSEPILLTEAERTISSFSRAIARKENHN